MRRRSSRKSRSNLVLDFRKLYVGGVTPNIFQPIETPCLNEAEFEIQFCEAILQSSPAHYEALLLLGEAYSRQGRHQKSLELDLRLAKLRPDSERIRYNLACSYALTGQTDAALSTLSLAIELGYSDAEHLCHDRDLDAVKADPRFQALVRKLMEEQAQTAPQA